MAKRPVRADDAGMTSSSPARRLVLVPAPSTARERPLAPGVRRFRLAQLRLEGREVPRSQRFEHLKSSHD